MVKHSPILPMWQLRLGVSVLILALQIQLFGQCGSTITSFPYSEGFESGTGGWTNTGPVNDWLRNASGTPSSNTGPTSGASGSYYMYTEASSPNHPGKEMNLRGPCFDLTTKSTATISFNYHMYGSSMGTLSLQITTNGGGSWATIWTRSGEQGNSWMLASVNIDSYTGQSVQFRFNGVTGSSWRSDMAIDNISVDASGSSPSEPDLVIQSPSAPSSATAGNNITVSCVVSNQGTGSATSSTLRYYLSTNTTYESGDTYLAQDGVSSLSPGSGSSESASVALPSGLSPGTYYILFRADYSNAVAEQNESNNIGFAAVSIGSAPSCSDGIQNGDETGIDCGGTNCAPCPTGSSLWTQNGANIYYSSGKVGIGTATPDYMLTINGNVRAREYKATLQNWPDYVFLPDYDLPDPATIKAYIDEHGHLPNIPSAREVAEEGIELAEMNARLLEKIEELTLIIIELNERVDALEEKRSQETEPQRSH